MKHILIAICSLTFVMPIKAKAEAVCQDQGYMIRCLWDKFNYPKCLDGCPTALINTATKNLSCQYLCESTGHHEWDCIDYCPKELK